MQAGSPDIVTFAGENPDASEPWVLLARLRTHHQDGGPSIINEEPSWTVAASFELQ